MAATLMLLCTTGMRRREIWELRLSDLDWERGRITICCGKGGNPSVIPFHRDAQWSGSEYIELRQKEGFEDPALWLTEKGNPIGYDSLGTHMRWLADQAGVPIKDVFHIQRRTFARDAKRHRIDTQHILGTAGWNGEQMLNRYTAAMREEEDERLQAFDGFDSLGN